MKVAALQLAPTFANAEENVATACELLQRLQAEGVDLAVFPEAYLTGYCFSSKQEATDAALELRGQELQIIAEQSPPRTGLYSSIIISGIRELATSR